MEFNEHITSPDQIGNLASKFLDVFNKPAVFAFYGKMGAGKTTIIKAICEKLGAIDYVTSPSFAIINEYSCQSGEVIYHFDFYRIKNIEEAFDIGYEDYFYSNHYCFIEWPEKIETLLPKDTVNIEVVVNGDGSRDIRII
ncbi:MAG: tRNA (adenosine(37)-N6)-threonylcarbamoyltransferase complex ATPase subunit type 1 TsaE [Bacteroidota bacterium]|nr:tRNA (adenosine(37)-N6)-threonylcarbamoyltransferase complex ATPase subunit type 1 TsaE [Bacteroidota bacterium]MDP4204877.1 tRNA (adenosine(37)-N6)-threonylcarbamoyltransferase complex ATPase subunit type 1 TsaE [Bacteroidota bacterium]